MTPLDGLTSWLLIGASTGLLAGPILRKPRDGRIVRSLAGALSAALGGLLATRLGYGGLAAFDPRALLSAALSAVFFLLVVDARRAPAS